MAASGCRGARLSTVLPLTDLSTGSSPAAGQDRTPGDRTQPHWHEVGGSFPVPHPGHTTRAASQRPLLPPRVPVLCRARLGQVEELMGTVQREWGGAGLRQAWGAAFPAGCGGGMMPSPGVAGCRACPPQELRCGRLAVLRPATGREPRLGHSLLPGRIPSCSGALLCPALTRLGSAC